MKTFSGLYFFYVRQYDICSRDYKLKVYKCNTKDALHTIGEMYFTAFEHIERIDINEYTEQREKYWLDNGYEILEWKDKYEIGDKNE